MEQNLVIILHMAQKLQKSLQILNLILPKFVYML